MDFTKYIKKTDELGHIETEIVARNATLSIVANILNAFLSVHSMSQVELNALQTAINQENEKIDGLAKDVFGAFTEAAIPSDEVAAENLEETFGEDAAIEEAPEGEADAVIEDAEEPSEVVEEK